MLKLKKSVNLQNALTFISKKENMRKIILKKKKQFGF